MKILTTRSQLRHTLETGRKVIFEPGAGIGTTPPPSGASVFIGAVFEALIVALSTPFSVPSISLTYWTLTVPSVPSVTSSAATVVPVPAGIVKLSATTGSYGWVKAKRRPIGLPDAPDGGGVVPIPAPG